MNRKQRRLSFKHERIDGKRITRHGLLPWLVTLGAIVAFSALGLYVFLSTKTLPPIRHTDRLVVDRGRSIYASECASCHGVNLEGQPSWRVRLPSGKLPAPPHDDAGHTWHHTDQVLFDIIKRGPSAYPSDYATDMPAFSSRLSDQDIAATISFIKSTWTDSILQRQLRTNAQAR